MSSGLHDPVLSFNSWRYLAFRGRKPDCGLAKQDGGARAGYSLAGYGVSRKLPAARKAPDLPEMIMRYGPGARMPWRRSAE